MRQKIDFSNFDDQWDFYYSDEFYTLKGVELIEMFDRKIILSHEGVWCVIANSRLFPAYQNDNIIPFFPFLEMECELFISLVKKKLETKVIPIEAVYSFPLEYIISGAFNMKSDYWVKLSISWLKCFESNHEISKSLSHIMQSAWLSQSTRHLAKKMFFKFNKYN